MDTESCSTDKLALSGHALVVLIESKTKFLHRNTRENKIPSGLNSEGVNYDVQEFVVSQGDPCFYKKEL